MITFVISKWATVTVKQLCTIVNLRGEKKPNFFGFIFMKLLFCGKKLPANLRKLEKSNIFFDRTWLAWPPFVWKREGSSQRKLQKKWNRQKSEFQIANGLPHEFFCGKKNPNEKIKIIFSQKKFPVDCQPHLSSSIEMKLKKRKFTMSQNHESKSCFMSYYKQFQNPLPASTIGFF